MTLKIFIKKNGLYMFDWLKKLLGSAQDRTVLRYRNIVEEVNIWDSKFQSLSDEELREKTAIFQQRLREGEILEHLLPEAYGVVKNACRRLCGKEVHVSGYNQEWDMVPYDVQIIGAITMFHQSIAEMQTGEGKTLTATMPLYLHALTGKPVHLVTVNDYLAQRDCEWMGALFRWLGLSTGALIGGIPPGERKELYNRDILYGTASEFGFDYLRDNSISARKEDQVQRGYYYAIVDEIDSILIDEARTPLIISGPVPVSTHMYGELKNNVNRLVTEQRNLCNRIASEARKALDEEDNGKSHQNAYRKLWLVSKGTPHNKILKRMMEDPDKRATIDSWDVFFHSDQNKAERRKMVSELFIIIDEKGSEYELTDKGILAWGKFSDNVDDSDIFVMLDLSYEYIEIDQDASLSDNEKTKKKMELQETDGKRKERAHNIRQLLRAHLLMERDIEYIVQDEQIIIIDENTGRPQPGRRFSDGLHQAIEAKESVTIQKENQTYATITLQNFFRMYDKIAGMTGTAITEANEFKEIYDLDVLQIPSHLPCQRKDSNDEVYMTEREKYNAIIKDINTIHKQGRPILIGTESVEISEKLSRILRQNKLTHTVLNAKYHSQEAEVIANAGSPSAITLSTNMAGRGTDIKLKESIADIGGLHVIGTSRHQSRRTDRQLRGRCARQGDPGTSKFYISFEDPLMRLFASPKITGIIQKFRPPDGEAISAGILDKAIETAQKRVEQRNYTIRKNTLQYDDVMNKQRQEIYSFRNNIMHTDDIYPIVEDLLETLCSINADNYFTNKSANSDCDAEGYIRWLTANFPIAIAKERFDNESLEIEDIEKIASEYVIKAFKDKVSYENQKTREFLKQNDARQPQDLAAEAIRNMIIRRIDQLWQEHLLTMDHLRSEVHLHAIAQKDPLMEFKHEAFNLFDRLTHTLRSDIATAIFKFQVVPHYEGYLQKVLSQINLETDRSLVTEMDTNQDDNTTTQKQTKQVPVKIDSKINRNAPCPCGSGKKYKKCCGRQDASSEN